MKHTLLSMVAVATLAVPAAAQYSSRTDQSSNRNYPSRSSAADDGEFAGRIEQLQVRVRTGVQNGTITRQEAASLRQQLRQLSQLEIQYRSNGFTSQERADLQDELRDVRQDVRLAEGGTATGDQYGDRDGRSTEPRYDRNGRVIDDAEPVQRRTLGGIIDGVVSGSDPKRR